MNIIVSFEDVIGVHNVKISRHPENWKKTVYHKAASCALHGRDEITFRHDTNINISTSLNTNIGTAVMYGTKTDHLNSTHCWISVLCVISVSLSPFITLCAI